MKKHTNMVKKVCKNKKYKMWETQEKEKTNKKKEMWLIF